MPLALGDGPFDLVCVGGGGGGKGSKNMISVTDFLSWSVFDKNSLFLVFPYSRFL